MNAFKRKSLYLAVVAGFGAVGVAGSAGAVTLSQTGTGQVLIYPYYTVRNATDTYISVTNTTASAKAVKVRFLEGRNSREVLDFNLYLSANDMWSGAVVATADGAKLISGDKSCNGMAAATAPLATSQSFVNYAYASGANTEYGPGQIPDPSTQPTSDFEGQTLDRTREGYFEIIEMGTIIGGTSLENAVTHINGVPPGCATANALTVATTGPTVLAAPSGGLIGTASLLNVATGMDFSFDPVALSAYSNIPLWRDPGNIHPDMTDVAPKSSTVFKNGAPVTSNWNRGVAGSNADAVTAVLMHDRLMNDFILETSTASGTDWIVTMPTKRHYVPVDRNGTGTDYTAITPFTADFYTGGACEPVSLATFDREESTPTGGVQLVSPLPPGVQGDALCWESTVISFNTDSSNSVLRSTNSVMKTVSFQNGWMRMDMNGVNNNMTDSAFNTYVGLPTVGFMVQNYTNGNVGSVLSNYGGNFIHKYRTNITGSGIVNTTGE